MCAPRSRRAALMKGPTGPDEVIRLVRPAARMSGLASCLTNERFAHSPGGDRRAEVGPQRGHRRVAPRRLCLPPHARRQLWVDQAAAPQPAALPGVQRRDARPRGCAARGRRRARLGRRHGGRAVGLLRLPAGAKPARVGLPRAPDPRSGGDVFMSPSQHSRGHVFRRTRPYSAVFTVLFSVVLTRCSEDAAQYRLPAPIQHAGYRSSWSRASPTS